MSEGNAGPRRVSCCLLPPDPSFEVSLPPPTYPLTAPHSQSEKPGEALEGLRRETANPVVGEISRGDTQPQQAGHMVAHGSACAGHTCVAGACVGAARTRRWA